VAAVTDRAFIQAALFARHGQPVAIRPDVVDDDGTSVVRVYAVRDEDAARAFVLAELESWGNEARAEIREAVGWCVVVDLRPRIAKIKAGEPW
jgi:hypothetical protein